MHSPVRFVVAVVLLGLSWAGQARAGLTFKFSYDIKSGVGKTDFSGSGILTTTDVLNGDGSYTITGITGTRTNEYGLNDNITGLIAPDGFKGNDNHLFLRGNPYGSYDYLIDQNGLSFSIGTNNGDFGTSSVNIYDAGIRTYHERDPFSQSGTFSITPLTSGPVPEPSSLALCGIAGAVGLAVARFGRRRGSPTRD